MATTIRYNNINPFSGLAPTPLFSRSVEMLEAGERWGQKHNITLRGMMTGTCRGYTGVIADVNTLVSRWAKNYQTLEIYDGASLVTGYSNIQVEGIRFPTSSFGGPTPFEISIFSYPTATFADAYKVLSPVDSFEFSEDAGGIISLTHLISAKGIPTSSANSNALYNASGWVASRTGWSSQVMPIFATGTGFVPCLQTVSETVDRINGTYEIKESYTSDKYSMLGGILRYSTELSSGIEEGVNTVSVRGSLEACKNSTLAGMRSRYASFNAFNEANDALYMVTNGRYDLNPIVISKSVSENQQARSLSFDYIFSDDLKPITTFEYEISFDYDDVADSVSSSIVGTIISKGTADNRFALTTSMANSINLLAILQPHYNAYISETVPHLASYPLHPTPTAKSRSENEFEATITLKETYSNEPAPPPGLDAISYTLNFTPALHRYSPNPIYRGLGDYYVFDLGFKKRAAFSINMQGRGSLGVSSAGVVSNLSAEAAKLHRQYFKGSEMILESQNISVSNTNFDGDAAVEARFSCDQAVF